MKIACYCQHVLGIGHFHRCLAICRELAAAHDLRLIVGGPPVRGVPSGIVLEELPGLQMDENFQNLTPCDPTRSLAEVKEERAAQLLNFFRQFQPDIFLVELYPFGRKAFRFELDPVLAAIKTGDLAPCRCYVSLRDILVERPDDREKFEKRAVTTLNDYFAGLLIHADPTVVTLEETFSRVRDIQVPVCYTGFIAPQTTGIGRARMRRRLGLADDTRLVVVSIGGGNVGGELLTGTVEAAAHLADQGEEKIRMQLFCGPYCPEETVAGLRDMAPPGIVVDRFTQEFADWLGAADLSISMGGYNTTMNLAQAGIPALVLPFAQNREQTLRASRLAAHLPLALLAPEDLAPGRLATRIMEMLTRPHRPAAIDLLGAGKTRQQLELWNHEAPGCATARQSSTPSR